MISTPPAPPATGGTPIAQVQPQHAKPQPLNVQYPYVSVASWYKDAGGTACGFHAGLGVANKTLACGTKITFWHAGRTATAIVQDRGPYIPGRDWDLNQNLAAALAFDGVGDVRWRYGGPPPPPPALWRIVPKKGMKVHQIFERAAGA